MLSLACLEKVKYFCDFFFKLCVNMVTCQFYLIHKGEQLACNNLCCRVHKVQYFCIPRICHWVMNTHGIYFIKEHVQDYGGGGGSWKVRLICQSSHRTRTSRKGRMTSVWAFKHWVMGARTDISAMDALLFISLVIYFLFEMVYPIISTIHSTSGAHSVKNSDIWFLNKCFSRTVSFIVS